MLSLLHRHSCYDWQVGGEHLMLPEDICHVPIATREAMAYLFSLPMLKYRKQRQGLK
jgi:hypothetical protein